MKLLLAILPIRTMIWCVYDKEDSQRLARLQERGWQVKESRQNDGYTIYILEKQWP